MKKKPIKVKSAKKGAVRRGAAENSNKFLRTLYVVSGIIILFEATHIHSPGSIIQRIFAVLFETIEYYNTW